MVHDDYEANKESRPLAVFYAYEPEEVDTYSHASGYAYVVYEMKEKLRSLLKYDQDVNSSDEKYQLVEKLRDELFDMCIEAHLPDY